MVTIPILKTSVNLGYCFIVRINSINSFEGFYPFDCPNTNEISCDGTLYLQDTAHPVNGARIKISENALMINAILNGTYPLDTVGAFVTKNAIVLTKQ